MILRAIRPLLNKIKAARNPQAYAKKIGVNMRGEIHFYGNPMLNVWFRTVVGDFRRKRLYN